MTVHMQRPFVTRDGKYVSCDEGMFEILTLLKKMGVETQFSCQGDDFGGYICAFTPDMRPLINKVIFLHSNGLLTPESAAFMDDWCRDGERHVRWGARRGVDLPSQYFSYERDQHSMYGDRTTIRWPKHRRDELKQLIIEVRSHI